MDAPVDWLVMNAPRPLVGTLTIEDGEFLTGRFYAAIDHNDPMAERHIEKNIALDAVIVLVADADLQIEMALNSSHKYREAYLKMSPERRATSIKPLLDRIQNKPYAEALALLNSVVEPQLV
jgi:hypothetical protein